MKSFKIYLEDKTTALIPKGGTLEDFLRSLEGRTIKDILDDGSYMNLYMGNKYGIGVRERVVIEMPQTLLIS